MVTTNTFLPIALDPEPVPGAPASPTPEDKLQASAQPTGTTTSPPLSSPQDDSITSRHPSQYPKDRETTPTHPREQMDYQVTSKPTETPEFKEKRLRIAAIRQMTQRLANNPNGTGILPPPFYRRDCIDHPDRPVAWIKNWKTGSLRPRVMMDDFRGDKAVEGKRKAGDMDMDTDEGYCSHEHKRRRSW